MAFVNGLVPERFRREITASAGEFERDLRNAWPAGVESPGAGWFRLHSDATTLDVRITPQGVRRLGLFELPVLCAEFEFRGGDDVSRRRMLGVLDRAMQRGGG